MLFSKLNKDDLDNIHELDVAYDAYNTFKTFLMNGFIKEDNTVFTELIFCDLGCGDFDIRKKEYLIHMKYLEDIQDIALSFYFHTVVEKTLGSNTHVLIAYLGEEYMDADMFIDKYDEFDEDWHFLYFTDCLLPHPTPVQIIDKVLNVHYPKSLQKNFIEILEIRLINCKITQPALLLGGYCRDAVSPSRTDGNKKYAKL